MASPHTRGWTLEARDLDRVQIGFPAHAGMDRCRAGWSTTRTRLPRTRGDGPTVIPITSPHWRASPHTRGWTRPPVRLPRTAAGFPAHAGMDRSPSATPARPARLPRTRGDGPAAERIARQFQAASPHTRGWTRHDGDRDGNRDGFPAHAGMDLRRGRGLPPCRRLPRTRGDGPVPPETQDKMQRASPHTPGWTLVSRLDDHG